MNDYIIPKYVDSTTAAFLEDVEIWHNKVRVDNPLLCAGDGPIHRLRQWYTQFYLDRSAHCMGIFLVDIARAALKNQSLQVFNNITFKKPS